MVRLEVRGKALIVDFGSPRRVATTAHVRGLVNSSTVAIYQVDEDENLSRPEELKERVRAGLGLGPEDPLMLTAADVRRYVLEEEGDYGVLATTGLKDAACPNMRNLYEPLRPSTINVIAWVPDRLTNQGLLDLLRTVAEAKAAAAADLLLRCDGRATGTVSDAVTVASQFGDDGYLWAGPATSVGGKIARLTYKAITSASRGSDEVLSQVLGLGLEELTSDALKLYRSAPVPGAPEDRVGSLVKSELADLLADPNVWAFLIAARELDIVGSSGLIPGLSREEFEADSKRVIADELLAAALSIYINGFKALTATYWADSAKDRLGLLLSRLPMFEDDAAAALAASALSRVYDRLLRGGQRA